MYRDDHEAALLRIDALERENQTLELENARLRRTPPPLRTVVARRPAPTPASRPRAVRPDMTTKDWIIGGLLMAVIFVVNVCSP